MDPDPSVNSLGPKFCSQPIRLLDVGTYVHLTYYLLVGVSDLFGGHVKPKFGNNFNSSELAIWLGFESSFIWPSSKCT